LPGRVEQTARDRRSFLEGATGLVPRAAAGPIRQRARLRIPLIVIAGSGIVISDSGHRDLAAGAKR
jgi:hypothetical protein